MSLLFQKIINSIIQIIVFSIIPVIWWLVSARKECSFFAWIGLKKIKDAKSNRTIMWIIGTEVAFLMVSVFILYSLRNVETATSEFSGLGLKALPAILVYALFNTSLPEEMLFRGFLLKRISNKFGFAAGNVVQSVLFGLIHGIMFVSLTGVIKTAIIIVFTGGIGWCMGYINEKKADGSILASWSIHAAANMFAGICSAFLLL